MREYDELEFEWDEAKAAANWKKHGVDFRDAVRVFSDPFRKEFYDAAHSDDEDRYNTIDIYGARHSLCRIRGTRRACARDFSEKGHAQRKEMVS